MLRGAIYDVLNELALFVVHTVYVKDCSIRIRNEAKVDSMVDSKVASKGYCVVPEQYTIHNSFTQCAADNYEFPKVDKRYSFQEPITTSLLHTNYLSLHILGSFRRAYELHFLTLPF